MSYAVVYSRDRAIDQTRAQIATQGPKIVAQMLTYDPKIVARRFRARPVAGYRQISGQLATQQDIVQKGNPVINEYWVTDSSIQSATPDRATMLLFMQGRRGDGARRTVYHRHRPGELSPKARQAIGASTTSPSLTKPKPPGNGK